MASKGILLSRLVLRVFVVGLLAASIAILDANKFPSDGTNTTLKDVHANRMLKSKNKKHTQPILIGKSEHVRPRMTLFDMLEHAQNSVLQKKIGAKKQRKQLETNADQTQSKPIRPHGRGGVDSETKPDKQREDVFKKPKNNNGGVVIDENNEDVDKDSENEEEEEESNEEEDSGNEDPKCVSQICWTL